jgi:kynurenine formamidase
MEAKPKTKATLDFRKLRVVDLSKRLDPATERRRCVLRRYLATTNGVTGYWSDIDIMSHLGTHLEFPYHQKEEWKDGSKIPVETYVGRGVLLNLATARPRQPIRRSDLDAADRARVQRGDVVLLDSPYHSEPFVPSPSDQRPDLSEDSAHWFLEKRVKCVGWGEGIAIENYAEGCTLFHEILLGNDILLLEVVTGLSRLREDVFMIVFAPLPIAGLDSCPVRVLAIEGLEFAD